MITFGTFRRRWIAAAKVELLVWLVLMGIIVLLVFPPLHRFSVPNWSYGALALGSLMLTSRVGWWLTLIVSGAVHLVHPNVVSFHVINAVVIAAIFRTPLFLLFAKSLLNTRPCLNPWVDPTEDAVIADKRRWRL
jgi:hypothetical protein